jgi:hypothetical protein
MPKTEASAPAQRGAKTFGFNRRGKYTQRYCAGVFRSCALTVANGKIVLIDTVAAPCPAFRPSTVTISQMLVVNPAGWAIVSRYR